MSRAATNLCQILLVLGAAWSSVALPSRALACPVCFAARDEANRVAFLGTTILLTSLPVIMIGGVIVWVARRARELEAPRPKKAATRQPAAVPQPALGDAGAVATGSLPAQLESRG